ncbi:MAG: response regulator [Phycisphaerales bacterium]|nr:MAG: response regulator [Phycisphaerales bacterium]
MDNAQTTSSSPYRDEISRLVAAAREHGEADSYEGRRRWVRYAIGMKLEVTREPDKPWASWSVVAHNISGGGIGFWSKHKLAVGSGLSLRKWTEDKSAMWLPAHVTHCAAGIHGYLIGAAFTEPHPPDGDVSTETEMESAAPPKEGASAGAAGRPPSRRMSLGTKCACASALAGGASVVAVDIVCGQHHFPEGEFWATMAGILLAFALGALVGWIIVRSDVHFLSSFGTTIRRIARGETPPSSLGHAPSSELIDLRRAILDFENLWRQSEDDGRIQRQKLEELNQIKSNILAIVSHDLRTPLTSILLYTRMLTEGLETLEAEDQRGFLQIISDECSRLSRLVDDLLEVQRLESGRARWDIRPRDLSQVITACANVFEAMALSKSIEFEVDCPDSLPPIEADADRIAQVVSNLLSNAIKYTPSGGTVRLSARSNGSDILIRVADTGPGIPREKWEQVFDRFSQLSNPDVREIAGVGLGLCIVRQIVEHHGGVVWVDSEVGRGSEFFVSLPIKRAGGKAESAFDEVPTAGRVLVCDADPELAAIIAQTLRGQDFDVRTVHSGCRLLAQLEQADIDVVVTDVLLPDMHAAELLAALDAVSPRLFRLVIHSYAGDGPELRRHGVDIFLRRPASKEDLIQGVQVAMRKRSSRGLTVLLVKDEGFDGGELCSILSERGHLPIVAETIREAADQLRQYPVDVVLLSEAVVCGGWANLEELRLSVQDNVPIMILCESVRRKERQLAESCGVQLIRYRPGGEEEALDAVTATREMLITEFSS